MSQSMLTVTSYGCNASMKTSMALINGVVNNHLLYSNSRIS